MSSSKPVEDQLRDLVAAGELEEAIKLMMREYGPAVFTQVRRIVKLGEVAKDAYQQTFIQAHRGLASFDGRSTFKTWLLAIASNRAIDGVRKLRREGHRTVSDDTLLAHADDRAVDPRDVLDSPRLLRALEECIEKLSPEARAAVLFRFKHERSYEDMAKDFGERSGTLHARVTRAMPILRECIEDKGLTS